MLQKTLCLIKPDGLERGLAGPIITRLEQKGFRIVGMRFLRVSEALAMEHYREHTEKSFFPLLIDYITSGPIIALCLEGNEAVQSLRSIVGNTNPSKAAAGTIRGDFALTIGRNLIHAADSEAAAQREIALFFSDGDLLEYERTLHKWIHRDD